MLTFFTTAKPFRGHIATIQRNALKSWKLLDPDVEIIVFGDDAGSAEVCTQLALQHEPRVEKTRFGANRLDSMFSKAQEISRHALMCYANCDILLTQEFLRAVEQVAHWRQRFLGVGKRWDTDVTEEIDFSRPSWAEELLAHARGTGYQRFYYNVDYFVFPRGLYTGIAPLGVGRLAWDTYLVWKARELGAEVVDLSDSVTAVHQNHDYAHYTGGMEAIWTGEEAQENIQLAGGRGNLRTIEDARYRLSGCGFRRNRLYWLAPGKRKWRKGRQAARAWLRTRMWHPLLDATRPLRHALGLRQATMPAGWRKKKRVHWLDDQ